MKIFLSDFSQNLLIKLGLSTKILRNLNFDVLFSLIKDLIKFKII